MAAAKRSAASKKRKPANSRPRKVRHSAKPSAKATIERAESEAPGFQRKPSWGANGYLLALLGQVTKASFGGFASPRNASEADVQIRTMAGVAATAARSTSEKEVTKVLGGKKAAKPPIADSAKLTELAAQRAVADLDG